ncbi:PREDICTED: uncharacterized protein LOC108759609 [Trachymyrmex cornetzi]|uniref:Myb/SANT-like DNA-binding domain-containing protein n=1 Tax=Trachymyrmex cornetzi TaxID=471704 RepID=A0A151J9Z7_9HYME|nr:PREDICTED: uncharacterized protein LOC108759609 [Trachymyrmex cornetzi]KYN21773.1 hypothetical protein ALC57_05850 [Trachymyrmex cornetzi]
MQTLWSYNYFFRCCARTCCFIGKEVYMNNNLLFTETDNENNSSNILSSEELSQNQDQNINEINKEEALWTKNKTMALLSLYETNMTLSDNPRKKTKLWTAIAAGLNELNIKVSADQVRWRMNYLMKKYKECIDNNLKFGRGTMTFEFFDQMEDMFGHKKSAAATYTTSSILLSDTSKNSNIGTKIQSSKKQRTEHSNYTASISKSSSTGINYKNKENEDANKELFHKVKSQTENKKRSDLENVYLEYLQSEEKRRTEHNDNILKAKKEALKLKKHYLEVREKELEMKKI